MSNSPSKPTAERDEDAPLTLADTGAPAGGRGVADDGEDQAASARAAEREARARDEANAASDGSSRAGGTSSDTRGKSTSFDTMLGRAIVERGLAAEDEIELCHELQRQSVGGGEPRTLADVLIDNEYLTRRQLDRLRQEFDAEKTTQQIPGYKILKRIGSGAMATVFLARQISLDRLVAIKVLPSKFSQNEKFIDRFYKEGKAAAQLNHRNIVGAYDVGQAGEHHYFVMEYVDGPTIYDRLKEHKRFTEREAIDVTLQVARALEHAHGKGFIHRDIKPKNIMIDKGGDVKLADLGLARAMSDKEAAEAEAGRAYGTPYYISPEQIRGEVNIGPQADIYGLGATLYHMVTGRVPFEGKNPSAVMHKHLKSTLVPPDHVNPKLSPGIAQVIEMMMAKSRRDRYRRIEDVIEDLKLVKNGEPPRYARGSMDITKVATAIESSAAVAPVKPQAPAKEPKPPSSPLFLVVLGVMILSLLGNLLLIALLVTG